jgi:hypothetical protein
VAVALEPAISRTSQPYLVSRDAIFYAETTQTTSSVENTVPQLHVSLNEVSVDYGLQAAVGAGLQM